MTLEIIIIFVSCFFIGYVVMHYLMKIESNTRKTIDHEKPTDVKPID